MSLKTTAFFMALLALASVAEAQNAWAPVQNQLSRTHRPDNISEKDIASALHMRAVRNEKTGHVYHYLQQQVDGIPVHNAMMTVVVDPQGQVMHTNELFVYGIERMLGALSPAISAENALQRAASHLGLPVGTIRVLEPASGPSQKGKLSPADISFDPIPFSLVLEQTSSSAVTLTWELVIKTLDTKHWWQIRVNAITGEVTSKHDWITTCRWDGDRGHAHNATCDTERIGRNPLLTSAAYAPSPLLPGSSYRVFEEPKRSPYDGARTLVNTPWMMNPNASPFGWHDTNGAPGGEFTITRGNNVLASEDRDADNIPGFSPDGGAGLDFDFALDLTQQPVTYQAAAITNLFYWNNFLHDVLYAYGFDEQSGNFQENNYGNGGAGNDYVIADAQDGSGTNNANFGTPPDGQNPRMQMFEWTLAEAPFFEANGVNYAAVVAGFGAQQGFWTGELVQALDGSAQPTQVCNAVTNGAAVAGKIALIDRGTCNFTTKVLNAQNAGAIAVVMVQNVGDAPFSMGGADAAITIPAVMISLANGNTLKDLLTQGVVNITLSLPASVNRDSDLDNEIIAHEYGHGLSNRLTAGADNVSCLFNDEQMGEGWSDYLGLITTMTAADFAEESRGMANYSFGTGPNGGGIRPFPYSFDLSINPVTYNDIAGLSIPHGVGSVWCSMLWDMTWLLIDQHGYDDDIFNGTGGNNIAFQLVVEGLKLQPCSPGFVDGRDAILLADQILYGGANQCLIWEAFARRGLGANASQGSSSSTTDGTESYELGGPCNLGIEKDMVAAMDAGTSTLVTLTVSNNSAQLATNVVITDVIPAEVSYVAGSASCPVNVSGGTLTFNLGSLAVGEAVSCTYQIAAPATPFTVAQIYDTVEDGPSNYQATAGFGSFNFALSNVRSASPITSWYAPDPTVESDFYLTIPGITEITASTFLSFSHYYSVETNWDGCVLEVSTNGGASYTDAGALITQNGYTGTINANPASAISGRPAFTGATLGFITTVVDLSSFVGQTINFRFRMASDQIIGGEGWYIDDIFIGEELVNFTNTACVTSDQTGTFCASRTALITAPGTNPQGCFGDFNSDGAINIADFLILLADFGCAGTCSTDMNNDGQVNSGDMLVFLTVFSTTCP
jgi:uncharacterized repeat protein (TIGR01451 family)